MRRVALALVTLAVLVAGCTSDDSGPTTTTVGPTSSVDDGSAEAAPTPNPGTVDEGELAAIALTTEVIAELPQAIALAARPSSDDLYVGTKDGTVRVIEVDVNEATDRVDHQLQTTPILDLSDEILADGEQGLLGLAFSSDGRKLYVDVTAEPDGRTVILEYELGDRPTIDEGSRRELLTVEQPYPNHNGGQLAVGPDGYLYIALGDGGSGGDPEDRAQDGEELLGKILRIDPEGGSEDGPAYAIPPGNPFVDQEGVRPEIWLTGARNPWRFTFDRETGDLWVGDVGQDAWEEIDRLPATDGFDAGRGANLGWDDMEGSHPFEADANPPGATLPAFEYDREGGCAVIGGYVYRGEAIPGLAGTYLYGDSCRAGIDLLGVDEGVVVAHRHLDLPIERLFSLGEDRDGELYALTDGAVVRLLGADAEVDEDQDEG